MPKATNRGAAVQDTKQLARRMRIYYMRDGLWDLFVGMSAIAWGVLIRLDMQALIPVALIVLAGLVPALRPRVTFPRLGYARLRTASPARNGGAALAAMAVGAAIVLVTFRTGIGALIQAYLPVWAGLAVGSLVGLTGWSFGAGRFIEYGVLILLATMAYQWGGVALWLAVVAAGVAIAACGLVVLHRFVRDNPRVDTNGIN